MIVRRYDPTKVTSEAGRRHVSSKAGLERPQLSPTAGLLAAERGLVYDPRQPVMDMLFATRP